MKKVLLLAAAAAGAAYANSKYKSNSAGKDLWKQASDKPASNVSASTTAE
ncbi:DLW-39 family protein [Dermacoccaceae bacterium W4C1]